MSAEMAPDTTAEDRERPGSGAASGDQQLRRLRALLALQRQAAESGAWAAFHALAASIRDELDRQAARPASPAAVADVAHLQLRLELLLRDRLAEAAARQQQLAALRVYRALART